MRYVAFDYMSQSLSRCFKALMRVELPESDLYQIKSYRNGREQGFCISKWNGTTHEKWVFSECRNGDDMVLYRGTSVDFDINDVPSENTYKNAQYFDILNDLIGVLTKELR